MANSPESSSTPHARHLKTLLTIYNQHTIDQSLFDDANEFEEFVGNFGYIQKYFELLEYPRTNTITLWSDLPRIVHVLTNTNHPAFSELKSPIQLIQVISDSTNSNEVIQDPQIALLIIDYCLEAWLYKESIEAVNIQIGNNSEFTLTHKGPHTDSNFSFENGKHGNNNITRNEITLREQKLHNLRSQGYSIQEISDENNSQLIVTYN